MKQAAVAADRQSALLASSISFALSRRGSSRALAWRMSSHSALVSYLASLSPVTLDTFLLQA